MPPKFQVHDDIISPTYQDVLESLMSSPEVPWNWQDSMDYPHSSNDTKSGGYSQFICDIYNNGQIFKEWYRTCLLYTSTSPRD